MHNYERYNLADFFSVPLDEFKRLEDSFYEVHAYTASRGCVGQVVLKLQVLMLSTDRKQPYMPYCHLDYIGLRSHVVFQL